LNKYSIFIGLLEIMKIAKENHPILSIKKFFDQLMTNDFWLCNALYNTFSKISK